TRWLFTERFTDWDLGIVLTSELHAAAEGFWHGVDAAHPLHDHASAPAAAEGLRAVYAAVDGMVGELVDAIGADAVLMVGMNGMGSNHSDVPTMALLPELVSRWATGRRLLEVPAAWSAAPAVPPPAPGELARFDFTRYPALHPASGRGSADAL